MLKKILLSFLIALIMVSGCGKKKANQDSNQTGKDLVRLFDSYTQEETTKGEFKFKADEQSVYIKRNGDYSATPIKSGYDAFANDEAAYYMDGELLMCYDFATGKSTQITVLPVSKEHQEMPDYFWINAVIEDMFYITRASTYDYTYMTYSYHLLTNVTSEEFEGDILDVEDDYAIVNCEYATDVSPTRHAIYQLGVNGAKHIKDLGNSCKGVEIVGEKIYYCSYKTTDSMSRCTLYRCSLEGENKEKVAAFKIKDPYGVIVAYGYTEDDCTVVKNDKTYHYTYETDSYEEVVEE